MQLGLAGMSCVVVLLRTCNVEDDCYAYARSLCVPGVTICIIKGQLLPLSGYLSSHSQVTKSCHNVV